MKKNIFKNIKITIIEITSIVSLLITALLIILYESAALLTALFTLLKK